MVNETCVTEVGTSIACATMPTWLAIKKTHL